MLGFVTALLLSLIYLTSGQQHMKQPCRQFSSSDCYIAVCSLFLLVLVVGYFYYSFLDWEVFTLVRISPCMWLPVSLVIWSLKSSHLIWHDAHTCALQLINCSQVALAQMEYQLPRLTRMWTHLERQAGGQVKGMGEKQIEVDKRILRTQVCRSFDNL